MADNVEIELKLPLHNAKELMASLNGRAKFEYEASQHDAYYNAPHRDFLADKDNVNEWLRIRLAGDRAQVNYKDFQPHDSKTKTHCIEHEADVSSAEQLTRILAALDFVKLVDVKKTRRVWMYKDVEVSIDAVEDLGDYIELEYKGNLRDVDAARDYLFAVLKEIGAETGELDQRGYPYLVLEKHGLL